MNLTDIYRGYRRSEPPILWRFKLFIMIMFIACLSGYFAIVIINVNQDAPTIINFLNESHSLHVPNMAFSSNYKFELICTEMYYGINNTDVKQQDCKSDLTQPEQYGVGPLQAYWGLYLPSPNVIFKRLDKSNNYSSLISIALYINIIEEILPNKPSGNSMVAMDSEYDLFSKYIKEKRYNESISSKVLDSTSPYDDSILGTNSYLLLLNQYYQFRYFRKIKEFIKPSWMNDFGIPPSYEKKPYIVSTLLGGPLPLPPNQDNVNVNLSMIFILPPMDYIIEIEREVRSHTYLGGLGLMGGAWGLAVAMYACLFGTDALRPWGIVQSYCCGFSRVSKNKLKESLPIIPFFNTSNPGTPSRLAIKNLSLAEQNELILSRMDALELFLQDHVVNVRHLDQIRDKNIVSSSAVSSFTPNSNLNSIVNMIDITNNNLDIHNLNTDPTYSTTPTPVTVISSQQQQQQQQQQGLMITTPPNFTQSATNYSDSFADNMIIQDDKILK